MEEFGIVMEVNRGKILVETLRKSCCSSCGLCSFSKESGKMVVEVENTVNALKGDQVKLLIAGEDVLKAALIVYALPLVFFLVFMFAGYFMFGRKEGVAAISGVLGLAAGFVTAKLLESSLRKKDFSKIKLEKI